MVCLNSSVDWCGGVLGTKCVAGINSCEPKLCQTAVCPNDLPTAHTQQLTAQLTQSLNNVTINNRYSSGVLYTKLKHNHDINTDRLTSEFTGVFEHLFHTVK